MTVFADLGLAEVLLRAVADEGYTQPTPIQHQAIPSIIAGHDMVGIAQTGTGKTAAFVLPILDRLQAMNVKPREKGCHALILVPTRELAAQIADCIRAYGRHMRVSHCIIVGGVSPGPQIRSMARGVDIIIATPGRLLDHMGTGAVRLDGAKFAVLDEADQMFDMGFIPAVRRIMGALGHQRQTIMFSATMPPQIRSLAADFLRSPKEISVAPQSRPIDRIDQRVIRIGSGAKRNALVDIVAGQDMERAIVFTRTKRGADRVGEHLEAAGIVAGVIHGNKSQGQRDRALAAFREGKTKVLVATDIAARGIDVDGVSHVVNFELPNVPESYVHRIGRTARAGADGVAVSLVDSSEKSLLRDIERLIGRSITATGEWVEEKHAAPRPANGQKGAPRNDAPRNGAHRNGEPRHDGGGHNPRARTQAPRGNRTRTPNRAA